MEKLTQLANAIFQAADDQHWDDLSAMLVQFNELALSTPFTKSQAATLKHLQETLGKAIELASIRRDEIGRLVDGLSGKR
jgi:hypothetical protein